MRATVLEAVKGRALVRAPQAVSSLDRSCAPLLLRLVGTKGVPRFARLRRIEQKAVQEACVLGGRPRRRGALAAALMCCAGRRLSGTRSACWRSR